MSERIDDGFSTTITFSEGDSHLTVRLYEKEITPPGIDGGGANDTSTMRNTLFRTRAPKSLITLTESTATISYDPEIYDNMMAMINVNQEIVITFADGSTLTFWGWVNAFTPGNVVEGEQPTATITIIPSNQDANGAEIAPVYADAA